MCGLMPCALLKLDVWINLCLKEYAHILKEKTSKVFDVLILTCCLRREHDITCDSYKQY